MRLSVVIPARNAEGDVLHLLEALIPQLERDEECIVVDDASTDGTRDLLKRFPVSVITRDQQGGPAAARNQGARDALGDVLLFLDADVVPHPALLTQVRSHFRADPTLAAVMGSYDDKPHSARLVSRFRNLLHCYTHRTGSREAFTFWAGCGAVRREVFHAVGGYNAALYPKPSIEDIELGLRMRRAGHRIILDPELQVQHRKVWTLASMIRTDLWSRAVPWSLLLIENREMPADLNLKFSQRISAASVAASAGLLLFTPAAPLLVSIPVLGLLGLATALNLPFYRFLARCGGWGFALCSISVHWVHYLCGVGGFTIAVLKRGRS